MVEPSTVRKLLDTIELRLARLSDLAATPLDEYIDDLSVQDQVERNFELCIQASIDLGAHILADFPSMQPETYADVFRLLGEKGLIDPELAVTLQQMAGFRNILAHGYVDISDVKVYEALGRLDDIREYVGQIAPYLERQGAL